jgi:hypothetical protein
VNHPVSSIDSRAQTVGLPQDPEEEWRKQADRIAASVAFRRSPRLRDLFRHIADRSIAGRVDELTEASIGRALYHRGADYLPPEDSSVRSLCGNSARS